MKIYKILVVVFITFFLGINITVKGQENDTEDLKFGIGISFFELGVVPYDNTGISNSVYTTFNIKDKFRLEPRFDFILESGELYYSVDLGLFRRNRINKFTTLYGIRIGHMNSVSLFTLSPTIGGEYHFINHFSVGSEVKLVCYTDIDDCVLAIKSSLIVRFYL